MGICNGFQVLCEAGLLPGALLRNDELRFCCRPGRAGRGRRTGRQRLSIPAKHGEGRYYAPEEMLDRLEANGQVAYRYADGHNSNGSVRDIAGVTNERGNVLGPDAAPRARGRPADRLDRRAARVRADGTKAL